MIIKHENMTFEIKQVCNREKLASLSSPSQSGRYVKGYRLIERNHKGEEYDFNDTIYTENGINQIMIERTRFCGSQIPNTKLIGE